MGFLTGFDHWHLVPQVGALIMVVVLTIVFIRGWRRNPGSPVLLMVLCTTLIVWQDPIMNWSPYAVYNPDVVALARILALVDVADRRTLDRLRLRDVLFRPYFPAIWILRKMQAKRGPRSVRHPAPAAQPGRTGAGDRLHLRRLAGDPACRTGLYIYSQAIPFGTLFPGTTFQFPLIWESLR